MKNNYNLRTTLKILFGLVVLILIASIYSIYTNHKSSQHDNKINVVAAENFWGSIAGQIGGTKVNVTSIVTDPNADPHEYETNNNDARLFSNADYVVLNGAGYDTWANKLLSAESKPQRKVLTVASMFGITDQDNPHMWYNPTYVNNVAAQIESDLISIKPADKAYFQHQYSVLRSGLMNYQARITDIKNKYAGTQVAETEDIFNYLAQATDLNVISPQSFSKAVAEGNDPPASSVAVFEQQLNSREVKMLVYNVQTVTPLTTQIKQIAKNNNIPVVGVSETLEPLGTSFQDWMNSQLINIQKALGSN
jgi:zinc/manganese transport system substrate-binding protein